MADSGKAKKGNKGPPVLSKRRTLDLITSLSPDDDEREATSKKISWILRHGASRVGIARTDDGFVKLAELLKVEILEDISQQQIMKVITDSNVQKPRYELKDSPEGKMIRAIKKEERKAMRSSSGSFSASAPKDSGKQISIAGATSMRSAAPEFVPGGGVSASPSAQTQNMQNYVMQPGSPMANAWAANMMGYNMMAMASAMAAANTARFQGKIKSFNDEKGFGFIESPQAHARYGRDVFLHKAAVGDLKVGADVTFTVETNKQGMPQAREVRAAGASGGGGGGKGKSGGGKGGAKGKAKGKSNAKGKGRSKDEKESTEESSEKKEPVPPGEQPAASS